MTIDVADQDNESDSKGSISTGKRADLVVLDQNPLKIDKMAIKDIKVIETIKMVSRFIKKETNKTD